jgi:RHS repeat-associated protein
LTLPSGKLIKATYDANRRKTSLTASGANGITDSSTTGFEYDDAGNLSLVKEPDPGTGQASAARATSYNYDERNRPMSVTDALTRTTSLQYDQYGRRARVQRPNGQTITYDSYDPMNRLLQQTVSQAPTTSAVTKYTWWPSGLLHTMEDPNNKVYTYQYDLLGRKLSLTYPPSSSNITESYTYDQVTGNPKTFTNRAGFVQTFLFDALNRPTGFDWNDGYTPSQQTSYDVASRVKTIANWDATINFEYFDDNLLKTQRELTGSNYDHTNTYAYDADGNRKSLTCPSTKVWQYAYNGRNQLADIMNATETSLASYEYDRAGNRVRRLLYNGTVTDYAPVDALDRSSWVKHSFNEVEMARFDYAFDEVNRLKYEQRDSGTADGYGYDVSGQLTAFNRDGALSGGSVTGGTQVAALSYDPSGNRTQVTSNGTATSWSVNDLNEYTSANGGSVGSDVKGNVETYDGWTYTYDAQNRLRNASKGATTLEFWYDGLNRQIARRINGDNNQITRSVWDGWNLLEERDVNDAPVEYYLHGARTDELVVRWGGAYGDTWYAQDGRGNVSHLFDYGGLVERYTYGFAGEPRIFDGNGVAQTVSSLQNRFMFQGREYHKEVGIYDYRNRFYHPTLGRFLQSDPLRFGGRDANLYRYCGGDPINRADPTGLVTHEDGAGGKPAIPWVTINGVIGITVTGSEVEPPPAMGPQGPLPGLDHIVSAAGEGSSRDTGGGGGSERTLYAQNAPPPMSNRVVEVAPLPEEENELPHDEPELLFDPEAAHRSAEAYRFFFNQLFGGINDLFNSLFPVIPGSTGSPMPTPGPSSSPTGIPGPSPSGPPAPRG